LFLFHSYILNIKYLGYSLSSYIRYYSSIKVYGFNNNNDNKNNESSSNNLENLLKKLSIKPIDIFCNLHFEETEEKMKNVLKNKSGVYMIINMINEKYYIGSGIKNRLYIRFMNHLIYYTGSKILAKAVKKYGLNNFVFIILEYSNNNLNKK
jgi:hypothetical protein